MAVSFHLRIKTIDLQGLRDWKTARGQRVLYRGTRVESQLIGATELEMDSLCSSASLESTLPASITTGAYNWGSVTFAIEPL